VSELLTIGHSNRPLEDFLSLLAAHRVARLVDIRRFPASRRHPHFGKAALAPTLADAGIDYMWMEDLGGRRPPRPESHHTGWRVAAFAGYADYMETAPFIAAATRLLDLADERRTVIMCAEALPESCHRRLVADWATVRGVSVGHILTRAALRPHAVPDFARVDGDRIIYDGGQLSL
jgi:uncharacterized protein (DUF488 family)